MTINYRLYYFGVRDRNRRLCKYVTAQEHIIDTLLKRLELAGVDQEELKLTKLRIKEQRATARIKITKPKPKK